MAVRVADVIKPMGQGGYPIAMAENVQVSDTDTRNVKEALEAMSGSVATTEKLGMVKINDDGLDITEEGLLSLDAATNENIGGVIVGDGVDLEDNTISVPFYAEVSDSEPENHNKLWIDTSDCYNFGGDEFTIENYNRYSTDEEIVCGCWIDGRPIYRKIYKVQDVTFSNTVIKTKIDTWDGTTQHLVKYGGIMDWGMSTQIYTIPFVMINDSSRISVDVFHENNVNTLWFRTYRSSSTTSLTNIYVYVEYVKLTDAENSFDESLMFSDTLQNEPTDEQYEEVWS